MFKDFLDTGTKSRVVKYLMILKEPRESNMKVVDSILLFTFLFSYLFQDKLSLKHISIHFRDALNTLCYMNTKPESEVLSDNFALYLKGTSIFLEVLSLIIVSVILYFVNHRFRNNKFSFINYYRRTFVICMSSFALLKIIYLLESVLSWTFVALVIIFIVWLILFFKHYIYVHNNSSKKIVGVIAISVIVGITLLNSYINYTVVNSNMFWKNSQTVFLWKNCDKYAVEKRDVFFDLYNSKVSHKARATLSDIHVKLKNVMNNSTYIEYSNFVYNYDKMFLKAFLEYVKLKKKQEESIVNVEAFNNSILDYIFKESRLQEYFDCIRVKSNCEISEDELKSFVKFIHTEGEKYNIPSTIKLSNSIKKYETHQGFMEVRKDFLRNSKKYINSKELKRVFETSRELKNKLRNDPELMKLYGKVNNGSRQLDELERLQKSLY